MVKASLIATMDIERMPYAADKKNELIITVHPTVKVLLSHSSPDAELTTSNVKPLGPFIDLLKGPPMMTLGL